MNKGKIEAMATKFSEKFAISMFKKQKKNHGWLDSFGCHTHRSKTNETPCRFVGSEIVKSCDELDPGWGGPFSTQACISFLLTDSSRRLRSKLNQIVDTTLAEIKDIISYGHIVKFGRWFSYKSWLDTLIGHSG